MSPSKTPNRDDLGRIVVVSENIPNSDKSRLGRNRELMKTDSNYIDRIIKTVEAIPLEPVLYDDPIRFSHFAHLHKSDTVLPLWSGTDARNSLNYVPAICEMHGIRYLGPDIHGRIIERDKWLSKLLARQSGFTVAPGQAFSTRLQSDDFNLGNLRWPLVIKPRFEGSSIGFFKDSILQDFSDYSPLVQRLYKIGIEQLVVEEFIGGRECHIVIMGNAHHSAIIGTYETVVEHDPTYFHHALFDVNLKTATPYSWTVKPISFEDCLEPLSNMFFEELGFPNLLRIDGKLLDGKFYFIEANALPDIGEKSVVAQSYIQMGKTYVDFLNDLLRTAVKDS